MNTCFLNVCVSSGLHPSKAKLELQRHLAVLENQEQASVFENTMVRLCARGAGRQAGR